MENKFYTKLQEEYSPSVFEEMKENAERVTDGEGNHILSYYLGTVFSLTPSGKYYQSFACGNVSEEEAEEDTEWYDAMETLCLENGANLEAGEGDPCDLFIVWYLGEDDWDF